MPYQASVCTCPTCTRDRAQYPDYLDYDESNESDEYYPDDDFEGVDRREGRVIQYHGYRPDPLVFHGKGPLYLGMELEVIAPSSLEGWYGLEQYAARVQRKLGDDVAWIQEDSSIPFGFELTSHPMSYRWAMREFPWNVLDDLSVDGFRVNHNVGLHVHVSRAAFSSECHLYRWMKMIYRNARQVQHLARRESGEWASFDPRFRSQVRAHMKGHDPYYSDTRYQAINPMNRDTLEVRVFASSLAAGEVKAALAFVASTVTYTRGLDASKIIKERGWAWSTYVDWLRGQPRYRPILDELEALSCVS